MLCRVGNVRNSWGGYGTALRGAVYLASLGLELSYAELLGRSVAASTRSDTDVRSRNFRGLGPLFMLRLTVCGYGAAHVLPGGGAAAASVTYGALRARRVDRKAVGCAVAAVPVLGYRLFNFWLPIPLSAIFCPGLRRPGTRERAG
jgi:hypothetical protein